MLIVIDMQPGFGATESVLDAVVHEVKKARRRNEWVLVVEYEARGRTPYRITRELKGYKKYDKVIKERNDGGTAIFNRLTRRRWSFSYPVVPRASHFKVCGINTDACVFETVRSLSYLKGKVTVLSHACAHYCVGCRALKRRRKAHGLCEHHHKKGLREMNRWHGVCVK